ncbi:cardiotrophin-2-like [Heptranchias perlo]|uniref:cardiotrophin-2-like n=1 Tax=Heptranchias perlo TaxID=212740 RepID=UPI00355A2207
MEATGLSVVSLLIVQTLTSARPLPLSHPKSTEHSTGTVNIHRTLTASLRLSRTILQESHRLQELYRVETLLGVVLETRRELEFLPSGTVPHSRWTSLQDSERLLDMALKLPVFRAYLERLRTRERERSNGNRSNILGDLDTILLHTRDLLLLIHTQMSVVGVPEPRALSLSEEVLNHSAVWDNLSEGYLVLRGFAHYLGRVVRDLTVLLVRDRARGRGRARVLGHTSQPKRQVAQHRSFQSAHGFKRGT